jgi:hypothetical protein
MCCPDPQTISAFADGELETSHAAEVERHIAKCASCRQFFEEMQWVDNCGRAALGAIRIEESTPANIIWSRPQRWKWARPLSLAAAAAVVLALSIWTWIASRHSTRHQRASTPHQVASVMSTPPGGGGQSKVSDDTAFDQWAAPYRQLHIPLVSMEVVENYNPDTVLPISPENTHQ